MEKIDLNQSNLASWPVDEWGRINGPLKGGIVKDIADRLNEMIDNHNAKCSPILCPFNTLIDQLAKRTKRLEFYDKQHRKEHTKGLK